MTPAKRRIDEPRKGLSVNEICIAVTFAGVLLGGFVGVWRGVAVMGQASELAPLAVHLALETSGFTLIELSIVLVIIGLVVGGILVGRDLIASAQLRAQISQIEKYQTAVNTFRLKFNTFPGDMDAGTASQLGFTTRDYTNDTALHNGGEMPGDGIIGAPNSNPSACGYDGPQGEQVLFWADLGTAGLINGQFTYLSSATFSTYSDTTAGGYLSTDLITPKAVLGNNHVQVTNCLLSAIDPIGAGNLGTTKPYFTLSPHRLPHNNADYPGLLSITSLQAYQIDSKIDDGQPMTGNVIAQGTSADGMMWSYIGDTGNESLTGSGYDQNIPNTPTFCYNNGNNSATTLNSPASMRYTRADVPACLLSFKLQ